MTEHLVGSRVPDLRTVILHVVLRYQMKRRGGSGKVTAEGLRRAAARFEGTSARWSVPPFVSIEPVKVGPLVAEWVSTGPPKREDGTILFFHGGGFAMGSPATHRSLTWRLARATGRRVLAIAYRKAPDHAFPAWVDDGVAAFHWLLEQGHAPKDVLFSGDSAGGNMALSVTHRLRRDRAPLPGGLVLFSPWADLACTAPSYARNARSEAMFRANDVRATGAFLTRGCDPRDPEVSPVHADLTGFPPMLLFAGSTELFLDDARTVLRNATAAGVPAELYVYRHMPHVFPVMAGLLPRAKPAFDTIAEFARGLHSPRPQGVARVA